MGATTLQGRAFEYRLESDEPAFLGRLAVLYRATATTDGREVILKVFRQEIAEADAVASFYAELDALRTLAHPHVLPVLDYGEDDHPGRRRFLVTPYCRGGNLRRLLAGVEFVPIQHAMPLLRQVAAAIDYAHSRGVIHGDIKPENILLTEDRRTSLLGDFGVARHFSVKDDIATILSGGKSVAGTSAYLSPEQLSENEQSARSDVYSFGLVAYELLTGRLPFDLSAPPFQQMLARVQGNLLDPRISNPLVSPSVSSALMRGLAVDPSDRPRSASALCELLSPARAWDVFIAYPTSDRACADRLYDELVTRWRVFIDHRCLLPGDDWDRTLSTAQRDSLVTVVLVSPNTEAAYYQREEVAAAIDLGRRNPESHRVVPVYLGPAGADLAPYGLRIKHGIACTDPNRIDQVAKELDRLLSGLMSVHG